MKRVLLLLFALITIGLSAQTTFSKRLNFDYEAAVLTSIWPTDSCYFATGIIADSLHPNELAGNIFVKFDLEGEVQFIKTLTSNQKKYITRVNRLTPLRNGGFLLPGYTFDSLGKSLLIKFDEAGDTIFTKEYRNPYDEGLSITPQSFVPIDDANSSFLMANSIGNPQRGADLNIQLLKLDPLGNIIWEKLFGRSTTREFPTSIVPTPDGGFIIGSRADDMHLRKRSFTIQTYILKVDRSGLWQWHYYSPEEDLQDGANAMVASSDGGLIIASAVGTEIPINTSTSTVYWDSYIFKLDAQRNKVWGTYFREGPTNPISQFHKIIATPDQSGFIAIGKAFYKPPVGEAVRANTDHVGYMVKVSPEGDSLWSRIYHLVEGNNAYHELRDIEVSADGGFVMVGQASDFLIGSSGRQGWLLKVDEYGCLVPGCQTIVDTEEPEANFQLKLFPNPASDYLSIFFRKAKKVEDGLFRIVNTQGNVQKIFSVGYREETFIVPLQDFVPGMYFLQYLEKGKPIQVKSFLVH